MQEVNFYYLRCLLFELQICLKKNCQPTIYKCFNKKQRIQLNKRALWLVKGVLLNKQ